MVFGFDLFGSKKKRGIPIIDFGILPDQSLQPPGTGAGRREYVGRTREEPSYPPPGTGAGRREHVGRTPEEQERIDREKQARAEQERAQRAADQARQKAYEDQRRDEWVREQARKKAYEDKQREAWVREKQAKAAKDRLFKRAEYGQTNFRSRVNPKTGEKKYFIGKTEVPKDEYDYAIDRARAAEDRRRFNQEFGYQAGRSHHPSSRFWERYNDKYAPRQQPPRAAPIFEKFSENYKPSFILRAPPIILPSKMTQPIRRTGPLRTSPLRFVVAADYNKFDSPSSDNEVEALLPKSLHLPFGHLVHVTSFENLGGIIKAGAILPSPKMDFKTRKSIIGSTVSLSSVAGPHIESNRHPREVAVVVDVTKLNKPPLQINYDTLKPRQMPWTAPAFSFEREWFTTDKIPVSAIVAVSPLAGAKNEYLRHETPARFRHGVINNLSLLPRKELISQKVPYNWVSMNTLLTHPDIKVPFSSFDYGNFQFLSYAPNTLRRVLGAEAEAQNAADKKYNTMTRTSAIPLAGNLPGSLETSLDYVQRYRKPGDKVLVQYAPTDQAKPGEHFALLRRGDASKQSPTGEPIISEYWPAKVKKGEDFDITGEEHSDADVYTQEQDKEFGPVGYQNYLREMSELEFQGAAVAQPRRPLQLNPDEQVVVAEEPDLSDVQADELADELLLNEYLTAQKRQEALEEADDEKDDDKDDDDEDEEKKEIAPTQ